MSEMASGGPAIRVDQVVAVVATLRDGLEQLGSGYLVSGRLVLTAEHCTRDKATGEPAARLRVVRASDGAEARVADVIRDRELDVGVLRLADDAPWNPDLPPPRFARVDQSHSGVLDDCAGIGFPLFQRDPDQRTRHTSEFHGTIYQTDERESGHLLMREPLIHPGSVTGPTDETTTDRAGRGPSPWGGLSGALMFYRGRAIGVVVEHHPRQGDNALRAIGFEQIVANTQIRQCLNLPWPDRLPCVGEQVSARLAPAGWPLAEVKDPFALEVHRPVQPDDPEPDLPELPELPTYIPRDHDRKLGAVVRAAAEGSSGIAVLIGGSSTGKTRACWEALQLLRNQKPRWWLWHPIDPTRPDAALRKLTAIEPRTVVWLNEAQLYLDVADSGLGEQVAAGLRELLRDPVRSPVLVLATLWPEYWHRLTARPTGGADPYAQARELLAARDITVPTAFTKAELQRLGRETDPRLAQAAAAALDGQVIQFLAGAPELLARYGNAPPGATALVHAAMDACRLGMGVGLPQAFLEEAATGYLTDTEWDALGDDWLEQALAYSARPCKGVRGPLTRMRPRPDRSRTRPGSPGTGEPLVDAPASTESGTRYRLADYLDQHGRHHRKGQLPPPSFWAAVSNHASPDDQLELGNAAYARGLYRDAAQLYKNAAAQISLDYPYVVAYLLDRLRVAGAREQVTALLRRDPAAHVSLDDPDAVTWLLDSLRKARAKRQVTTLAGRAVTHVRLDNLYAVSQLLDGVREAGLKGQVTMLLSRDLAVHAPLDDPAAVGWLLESLREAGTREQVTALLSRDPAAHALLNRPDAVAYLLDQLHEAGAQEQVTKLASRIAAHGPLDNSYYVVTLLNSLREAGAWEQVTVLLSRDPAAKVSLDKSPSVYGLLESLREAGAQEQVSKLASRAVDEVRLDYPYAVLSLLDSLRLAGAWEQVTALLRRDPAAHVSLYNPAGLAGLLESLHKVGAQEQITTLLRRDPAAHVSFDIPGGVGRLLDQLREAGAKGQITTLLRRDPAAHVSLNNPFDIAGLLNGLRRAGAREQVTALLRRDPATRVSLDDPHDATSLLDSLRRAGAREQVTTLISRLPGEGMFDLFLAQRGHKKEYKFGRTADGAPAEPWSWEDLS